MFQLDEVWLVLVAPVEIHVPLWSVVVLVVLTARIARWAWQMAVLVGRERELDIVESLRRGPEQSVQKGEAR